LADVFKAAKKALKKLDLPVSTEKKDAITGKITSITAQERSIVHRDVKPENVMLTEDGTVKLMDFGIARMLDDAQVTMTGALVGSPAYMSPEQATDGNVGHPSDLFAVGIMLYRMVTGTLPFRGSNPSIVIKAIIDGIYEDPTNRVPSLSPTVADIIRRCLNRDLDVRYSSASEVRADLRRSLEEVGIDPDDPGRWKIQAFLDDFEAYEEDLRDHVLRSLLKRGRAEAEAGRTAGALRAFNRVLALDEDNEEVVEIIEGMRAPLESETRGPSTAMWLTAAILVASIAAGMLWQLDGSPGGQAGLELAPAVLIPSIPVPVPDTATAPPEPATPEATAATADVDAVDVGRLAVARSLGVDVPDPTPELGTSGTDPGEPLEVPTDEPEVCEGTGILEIRVADNWTKVRINGKYHIDPDTNAALIVDRCCKELIELPAGIYEVRLEHAYRVTQTHRVRLCGGHAPEVLIADRELSPHEVRFSGFPPGAQVYVNDVLRGPATQTLKLSAGPGYQVKVVLDGRELATKALKVGDATGDALPGQNTEITPDT
jgi:hypothetical protein